MPKEKVPRLLTSISILWLSFFIGESCSLYTLSLFFISVSLFVFTNEFILVFLLMEPSPRKGVSDAVLEFCSWNLLKFSNSWSIWDFFVSIVSSFCTLCSGTIFENWISSLFWFSVILCELEIVEKFNGFISLLISLFFAFISISNFSKFCILL